MKNKMKQKIKILFVIENQEYGGGERSFEQIIRNINREKFEVYVACFNKGIFADKIKNYSQIIHIDFSNRFNFRNIFYLKHIIVKNKIDIVHSQGARSSFFASFAAKFAGVPVITTVTMLVEGFDVFILKKIFYIILNFISERLTDKFIVVSNELKRRLIKYHFIKPQNIEIIYNGIELNDYIVDVDCSRNIRNSLGLEENTILIGTVGRLVWQKGFEYFIDAIKILEEKLPNEKRERLKYLIVGEGKLKNKLINKVKKLGLQQKVIFTGFCTNVKEIISSLNVFILPSILEGQPIVLLEAMALGKPIVATDIPGVRESVVPENNVILVPSKNPHLLAYGILKLLKEEEKAKKIGENAKQYVKERFDFSKIILKYENFYEEIYRNIKERN
jgi:glycosyltransferase involved in cell wall biosynthesis